MHDVAREIHDLERRVAGWSPRGLVLYALPLPLVPALAVSLVRGDLAQIAGQAAALAGCWSAAALLRRGLTAESEWRRHRIARMPAPRKTAAALLLGASVGLAALLAVGHALPLAALLGAGAAAGCVLTWGLDPWAAKQPADLGPDPEDVLRTLEHAEARIARIEAAGRTLLATEGVGESAARLERIGAEARAVLDLLEARPRDLRRARRFLNVYLAGAERVSERYAASAGLSPELDDRFRDVLVTVERVFDAQRRHLLEDDALDLDVQIEVLARQLEGAHPSHPTTRRNA